MGTRNEPEQLFATEHWQSLAGVEHERDAVICELLSMLEHAVATVGGDDAQLDAAVAGHGVQVRLRHRSRVKCCDLVVVEIGGDERLRRIKAAEPAHETPFDSKGIEPFKVGSRVITDCRHWPWR